mmetsp:Transcript_126891/g.364971  ORF Transcript_126891/g.364971 Transcript_126891/m.364971 type:complete len:229 (+) Transcript_126891:713-1399(+)
MVTFCPWRSMGSRCFARLRTRRRCRRIRRARRSTGLRPARMSPPRSCRRQPRLCLPATSPSPCTTSTRRASSGRWPTGRHSRYRPATSYRCLTLEMAKTAAWQTGPMATALVARTPPATSRRPSSAHSGSSARPARGTWPASAPGRPPAANAAAARLRWWWRSSTSTPPPSLGLARTASPSRSSRETRSSCSRRRTRSTPIGASVTSCANRRRKATSRGRTSASGATS